MTPGEVLKILGEPTTRTISQGLGSPEWEYANGLTISLWSDEPDSPNAVWKIMAHAPFDETTAKGFRIGGTRDGFLKLYHRVRVRFPQPRQVEVYDDQGTSLTVMFDADTPQGKAVWLLLKDTGNHSGPLPQGSPGPGKRP